MRKYLPLAAVFLLLTGCASAVTAIVGQHVSDPTAASLGGGFEACEVTTDYIGVGRGTSWRHERGTTRLYGTVGLKDTRQCATLDVDHRDLSPGAQLLVIREFDRRRK
jgi:hypothetical protein